MPDTRISAGPQIMLEVDGWDYRTKPDGQGDNRKLVTLEDGGMIWIGIRVWSSVHKQWFNGGEPERCAVRAWRELPSIADGNWSRGELYIPKPPLETALPLALELEQQVESLRAERV